MTSAIEDAAQNAMPSRRPEIHSARLQRRHPPQLLVVKADNASCRASANSSTANGFTVNALQLARRAGKAREDQHAEPVASGR